MDVAFAHLDKRTSRMEDNISDRHKKSHFDERWHHIGQGKMCIRDRTRAAATPTR